MKSLSSSYYDFFTTAFDYFNEQLFDNTLPPVIFTVNRKKSLVGCFSFERWVDGAGVKQHEIGMNPQHISRLPLIEVFQTLVHEMVHEKQFCFGKPSRGGYHNKEWANDMISVGLMPSTTGKPGGKVTGQGMSDYPMPNGKFMKATVAFMQEKGVELPLVERWIHDLPDVDNEVSELLINESDAEITEVLEMLLSSTISQVNEDEINTLSVTPSTKTKYTCEGCGANVWGKAGLQLICEPCDSPLLENSDV